MHSGGTITCESPSRCLKKAQLHPMAGEGAGQLGLNQARPAKIGTVNRSITSNGTIERGVSHILSKNLEKLLCFSFLAISPLIMVLFEKLKKWHTAENLLYRVIVPTGGTAGHLGQNRDCPAEIGTVDTSAFRWGVC